MVTFLLHCRRLFPFLCGGHRQVALENLALRQQLAVYRRTVTRPRLRRADRLFWVWLARVWTGWRAALVIVAPDTVLRWQRRRFCAHWAKLSRRPRGVARPSTPRSKPWSPGWRRRIPGGARPESMASCRSWGSRWPFASDTLTATWQWSALPNGPQYWRATPTECRPFLGYAVSSTIHAATGPCRAIGSSTQARATRRRAAPSQGALATKWCID
jgi:hypothetical protein